jgi:hypothetical protein
MHCYTSTDPSKHHTKGQWILSHNSNWMHTLRSYSSPTGHNQWRHLIVAVFVVVDLNSYSQWTVINKLQDEGTCKPLSLNLDHSKLQSYRSNSQSQAEAGIYHHRLHPQCMQHLEGTSNKYSFGRASQYPNSTSPHRWSSWRHLYRNDNHDLLSCYKTGNIEHHIHWRSHQVHIYLYILCV